MWPNLIFLTIIIGSVTVLPCLLLKLWKQPKVGEVWSYQPSDPFEPAIRYLILERRKGYVKLLVQKGDQWHPMGSVTTESLLIFRDHATLVRKALPNEN